MKKGITVHAVKTLRNTKLGQAVVAADKYFYSMVTTLFHNESNRACMKYCKTTEGTFKVIGKISWFAAWLSTQITE